MKRAVQNLPESIRVRLNNYARANQKTFQSVFYLYAFECFLRRLSASKYCDRFILKGGVAFLGWGIPLRRVTKDIDFQGYTENNLENMIEIIKQVCCQPVGVDDGMAFDTDSVTGIPIMQAAAYQGIRILFTGNLGASRIHMQLDVSFANVVTPSPITVQFPSLLGTPKFHLISYPYETVIAEKIHAIADSGLYNDRYRDYYDIWEIIEHFEIQGIAQRNAIKATFANRKTPIPIELPQALSTDFAVSKQASWTQFLNKNVAGDIGRITTFASVVSELTNFISPILRSITAHSDFAFRWHPSSGWCQDK